MIYNGREDGWKAKDFHRKCDRKGPTVSFIQIEDGPCIGGFTTNQWRSCEKIDNLNDRYSFLFNLTDSLHFPVKDQEKSIATFAKNGPTYGLGDLVIFDKFNDSQNLKAMTGKPKYKVQKMNGKNLLTDSSEEKVTVRDIEMWQVIFTEDFQNEFCMQWLEEDHASEVELERRKKRDEWESKYNRD